MILCLSSTQTVTVADAIRYKNKYFCRRTLWTHLKAALKDFRIVKITNLNLFHTHTTFLIRKVLKPFQQTCLRFFVFSFSDESGISIFSIEKLRSVIILLV